MSDWPELESVRCKGFKAALEWTAEGSKATGCMSNKPNKPSCFPLKDQAHGMELPLLLAAHMVLWL